MIQVSEVIIITTWISVDYPLTSPVCEVHTLFIKITELCSVDTSKILFLISEIFEFVAALAATG